MAVKIIRFVSFMLLLLVGISAIYGGTSLILAPDGSLLQLPFHYVHNSPFEDYLIPGIILLVTLGFLSLLTAVLFKSKHFPFLVLTQGCIITGWIIVQIIMIQVIFWLQFVIGGTGMLLIFFGVILHGKLKKETFHER